MNNNIAVIMSVYKSDNPTYLNEAINSILDQSIRCDLFIYKDGKLPIELDNIVNYFNRYTNIHIYANVINNGLAFSLNFLIDTISTNFSYKYIARMDSDDIAIKNRLMFQADFLDKNPHIDVCGSYCHEFGSNFSLNEKKLPISHDEILNFSIYRCPLIHPCVMFRSEIFKSGYRYPTDTNLTEDMALWFLLLESGFKFHNIPIVLLNYRLSEDTINRRKGISKAISEIRVRLYYMSKLKKTSIKNIILILSRLPFHLLPSFIIKFFYKNFRQ